MNKYYFYFKFYLVVFLSFVTLNASAFARTAVMPSQEIIELAKDPTWLKLLHYDRHGFFTKSRSAIISPKFFFAEQGHLDPEAELYATIQAMNQPFIEDQQHPRCLFPAREIWLKQNNAISDLQVGSCPDWDDWQNKYGSGQIGLTFASGYLGNPASFFGHLLLHIKTNDDKGETASYLLDSSLNFGADVPPSDGIVKYMLKGVLGGYFARYSQAPFYQNTSVYNETQMRDSWLYLLNLDDSQRRFLIAHLFEILGHDFDYLFLSQNCASRIGRTLELVIDAPFTQTATPWVSPEQLIRQAASYSQAPHYYPSRRRITESAFHRLSAEEQAASIAVWPKLEKFSLEAPAFQNLPSQSRISVINTLLSHSLNIQQGEHSKIGKKVQHELLKARLSYPISSSQSEQDIPPPPHEALLPGKLSFGLYDSRKLNTGFSLEFRPLQYDLIESDHARMPYAALDLFNISVDSFESDLKLRHLRLFEVTNLNLLQTGLPTESSLAWQAQASVERSSLVCRDCLDASIQLSAGYSWQIDKAATYILVGGLLRTTGNQKGPFAASIQAGLLYDWQHNQRTYIKLDYLDAFQGENSSQWKANAIHRWQLSKRHELRFVMQRDRTDSQLGVHFSRYW